MLKRYVSVLFILLFLPYFLFAQSVKNNGVTKKVIDPTYAPIGVVSDKSAPAVTSGDPSVGESIGQTTDYDIFTNSVIRDQIVYYNEVPYFANMVRPWGGNAARRMIAYTYHDGTSYVTVSVFDSSASSGWPHIDISLTGSAVGTIGIAGHTPNRLAIWDGSSSFLVSEFEDFTDPSLQFLGDVIYLATSGNRAQFQFFKTEDFGISFENFDSISTWSPDPIFYNLNGGVEVGMSKSPDETKLVYFGTIAGDDPGAHVYDGIPRDSADNVWLVYTTDGGVTWNGESIGWDGDLSLFTSYHTPNYGALFENFGQIDLAVTNDGVMHAVANGYGQVLNQAQDSVIANSFPLLYWNSVSNEWKSISDPAIDTLQDLVNRYPGNMLGQSYPGIAASEDGQVIYVTWTGPQMTGAQVDTAANGLYSTDIYHAYSLDGGDTWTYGGVLPGADDKNIAEAFAHPSQHLQPLLNNTYRAHICYLDDLEVGSFVFGEGAASNSPIMYHTFDLTDPVGIEEDVVINSFELSQNYPNPFNPGTLIKYSIPERSNISLKVFDMLGREVAQILNTTQDAGSYEINFDASGLASGLYVYILNAGNYTSSKKMMLLK